MFQGWLITQRHLIRQIQALSCVSMSPACRRPDMMYTGQIHEKQCLHSLCTAAPEHTRCPCLLATQKQLERNLHGFSHCRSWQPIDFGYENNLLSHTLKVLIYIYSFLWWTCPFTTENAAKQTSQDCCCPSKWSFPLNSRNVENISLLGRVFFQVVWSPLPGWASLLYCLVAEKVLKSIWCATNLLYSSWQYRLLCCCCFW